MMDDDLLNWLIDMRARQGVKLVTGQRGWGKSACLKAFRQWMLDREVPPDRILFLDAEQPPFNRFSTTDQVLGFVDKQRAGKDGIYVLIREAGSLSMPVATISALSAILDCNIFATTSSRHFLPKLLQSGEGRPCLYACAPRILPRESAVTRWRETILNDALMSGRIIDVPALMRTACLLSDMLGDQISLRTVCAAISPPGKHFSLHTIETYLNILENAHIVEKCQVYHDSEGVVSSQGYRYFFMDVNLRQEVFGPAPADDARRVNLNSAWISLRGQFDQVFVASKGAGADFIARSREGSYSYWKTGPEGLEEVS